MKFQYGGACDCADKHQEAQEELVAMLVANNVMRSLVADQNKSKLYLITNKNS